jgi:quercetin dioxygenase-like cupin family protein
LKLISAAAISMLMLLTVVAQQPPAGSGSQALSMKFEDLKWEKMSPEFGSASPEISILRVDPASKATELLIRIPKQMHVPMHWHSANETHTVLQGTWVFEHQGSRSRMGPGSYNYIPARMHHQAWATDGAVVFITVDSGWDVNWVNGPPTQKDIGQAIPAAN